jgi:hypothetical protein
MKVCDVLSDVHMQITTEDEMSLVSHSVVFDGSLETKMFFRINECKLQAWKCLFKVTVKHFSSK